MVYQLTFEKQDNSIFELYYVVSLLKPCNSINGFNILIIFFMLMNSIIKMIVHISILFQVELFNNLIPKDSSIDIILQYLQDP